MERLSFYLTIAMAIFIGSVNAGGDCRPTEFRPMADPSTPTKCPDGYPDDDGALLCYEECPAGWTSDGLTMCYENCKPGWEEIAGVCWSNTWKTMPKGSKGRGAGVFPNSCGAGKVNEAGLCYNTCPSGYTPFACHCVNGFDWKDRGCGEMPRGCPSSHPLKQSGLCYKACPDGYPIAEGPVCWEHCQNTHGPDAIDTGAFCETGEIKSYLQERYFRKSKMKECSNGELDGLNCYKPTVTRSDEGCASPMCACAPGCEFGARVFKEQNGKCCETCPECDCPTAPAPAPQCDVSVRDDGAWFSPLDLPGKGRTVASPEDCRQRCLDEPDCYYFNNFPNGGCHLSGKNAKLDFSQKQRNPTKASGSVRCESSVQYRLSNNGVTEWRPRVKQVTVYSDSDCTRELEATYLKSSGSNGNYPAENAFDGNVNTWWRPQCHPCATGEASLTFETTESVGCVKVNGNLGEGADGSGSWNGGIKLEMKEDDAWIFVMDSDDGNSAKLEPFVKRACRAPAPEGNSLGDYGDHNGQPKSLDECKALCRQQAECTSFVFSEAGQKCHLKDKVVTESGGCADGSSWNFETYYLVKADAGICIQDTPITGTGTASDAQSYPDVALTSDSFTVSTWLNIDDDSHDVGFFSYGRYPSCGFMCQARVGRAQHDIHCRVSGGSSGLVASNSVTKAVSGVAGSWEHLVVVKDDTAGQIRFYVNGQPKGVNNYNMDSETCSDSFQLGGWPGDNVKKYLDGSISGAYAYDKALSDTEVASLYTSTKDTKRCPGAEATKPLGTECGCELMTRKGWHYEEKQGNVGSAKGAFCRSDQDQYARCCCNAGFGCKENTNRCVYPSSAVSVPKLIALNSAHAVSGDLDGNLDGNFCCQSRTVDGWNGNWNGVCWGLQTEADCNSNDRKCEWTPDDCRRELDCLLLDEECEWDEDCCSGRCNVDTQLCR